MCLILEASECFKEDVSKGEWGYTQEAFRWLVIITFQDNQVR